MPQKGHLRKSVQSPRRRPVSCYFCRRRKLRCSRQFPCNNCDTRGISCQLWPSSEPPKDELEASPPDINERLQQLEETVALLQSQSSKAESNVVTEPRDHRRPTSTYAFMPGEVQQLTTDAAWLEGVFTNQNWVDLIPSDKITFRICPIHQIIKSTTYLCFNGSKHAGTEAPIKCIWLPRYEESKILLEKYISDVSPCHHIVHAPSLRQLVDNIYLGLRGQTTVDTGNILLLLSVISSATFSWNAHDNHRKLFFSPTEANAHSASWIKTTLDLLHHYRWSTPGSVECIQAIIITAIVICNAESLGSRARSLMSMAITMARELSLHQLDSHPSPVLTNVPRPTELQLEVGRRLWWHLASTDWMTARFAGPRQGVYTVNPRQMMVNKPKNINDEDLIDGMSLPNEQPLNQPTSTSYLLQRIRVAELFRRFTDRTELHASDAGTTCYRYVLDTDAELKRLMNELPSFFTLEGESLEDLSRVYPQIAPGIITQRYLLQTSVEIHRCKLHLPYLVRASVEPAFAYSRQACLKAAKHVIYAERQLSKEKIPYASIRYKVCGILYAVFMASIALGLDLCLNKGMGHEAATKGELLDACRILEVAKSQSASAARLSESLMHVLSQHEVSRSDLDLEQGAAGAENVNSIDTIQKKSAASASQPLQSARKTYPDVASPEAALLSNGLTGTENILQFLEGRTDADIVDWASLFRDLDQTFI